MPYPNTILAQDPNLMTEPNPDPNWLISNLQHLWQLICARQKKLFLPYLHIVIEQLRLPTVYIGTYIGDDRINTSFIYLF